MLRWNHASCTTWILLLTTVPFPSVAAHGCVGLSGSCGVPCPYDGRYHDHTEVDVGGVRHCRYPDWDPPCPDQPTHTYEGAGGFAANASSHGVLIAAGYVLVKDTNTGDCGTGPADWDGDYDSGTGGAFFGHGAWASDPDCNYRLNVHGPNVAVNDVVFGNAIAFVTAENDRDGPTKIWNPATETWVCETDGSIRPGDPAENPAADPDDCVSEVFVGSGTTCGSGGGDGGYWVVLMGAFGDEADGGVALSNPPTTGTITAF